MMGATELQTKTFHIVKCPRGDRPGEVSVEEVDYGRWECAKCPFFGGFAAVDSIWCFYLKKHNDHDWVERQLRERGL